MTLGAINMLGDILDGVMREQKITSKKLSELIYDTFGYTISKESIAKYRKNERKPPPELIKYISDILHISTDYLLGQEKKPVVSVPIRGSASCGGNEINYLQERGKTAFYGGDNYNPDMYSVIAVGDCMAPDIENGEEVICNPRLAPESGDLVHYKIGEENAIKVLWIDEEANLIQFIPYTQTDNFKTKTIRMDDDEYKDLEIARVVAINKIGLNNKTSRLKMIGRL